MNSLTKNLPPLPGDQTKGQLAPAPPSHRPQVAPKLSLQGHIQALKQENEQLWHRVAMLEKDQSERDQKIQVLSAKNRQIGQKLDKQRRMVAQIACTITDAFKGYQNMEDSTEHETAHDSLEYDIPFIYDHEISAWSDSS